jgi:hypothetical protein
MMKRMSGLTGDVPMIVDLEWTDQTAGSLTMPVLIELGMCVLIELGMCALIELEMCALIELEMYVLIEPEMYVDLTAITMVV